MCYILTSALVLYLQCVKAVNPNLSLWRYCYLRNTSAPAVNCWVIIHCLEVSCKEDQITSAQREWFIFVQLTYKQWIITQQFTHWNWSISILTHNKRWKHIRSLQLLPTFRHCTEELPPILRLRRIRLHVIVTSFKRENDVTPSNAMNDVIFQWRQLSHTLAVNYCPIYHGFYRWLYRRGVLESVDNVMRWCIDKLGVSHANQTSMCLDPHLN